MIQVIKRRNIWFTIEIITVILSIIFLIMWGLRPGMDFTGGSLLEIKFSQNRPDVGTLKDNLKEVEGLGSDFVVQPVGNDKMIIRFQNTEESMHQALLTKLNENYQGVTQDRYESIGPSIGKELKTKAFYAVFVAVLGIIIYIAWAFRKVSWPVKSWKYGLCAIIALIHDILVVIGVFALLGHFMNVEIDLPFIAALLTILGYSVHDTIVVFDRIRENLGRVVKTSFEDIVNRSINETFARSINTTVATLLSLIAIYLFGGESIKFFALALIIGITSGTYSSIFIASPLLVVWENFSRSKK